MQNYLNLMHNILNNGIEKTDRTATGTLSLFGEQLRFKLSQGFPLLTTKKIHFKSVAIELLWFLKGQTNTQFLKENGVSIWDEWADENGELGPIYGKQWRFWQSENGTIDQIQNVIDSLKTDPHSRRHIVCAWNVADLPKMALSPCHAFFQFYVARNQLSCHLYQRSADLFLGVPFNIASYALLTQMIAHLCHFELGDLILSFGDVHLYQNHLIQAQTQLGRMPKMLPTLQIKRQVSNINDFVWDDFEIQNYNPHPHIAAKVAV